MKKLLAFIPFMIACCLLIGAVAWGLFGIYDIHRELERLENMPGASGVDYLGVHFAGFIFGGGIFLASIAGMIFSVMSGKMVKNEKLRTVSGVLMVLFALLIFLSMGVFFLGRF